MLTLIYFDNAATTWPKPKSVVEAVVSCMKYYGANPGRSAHAMSMRASEKVYECREAVASMFDFDNPNNVIFTANATQGLNQIIIGALGKGSHVICTQMDHNSVLRPVYSSGAEVSVAPADSEGYVSADAVLRLIRENTRLIVMTHVSNVCGTIMPVDDVAEIARKRGILFLLDASQSAGIIDISLRKTPVDFLVCPGHKSLYGPMGTGVICINTDAPLRPIIYGGTGSYSHLMTQPDELPDRFESGTLNLPGICGLLEGIRYVSKIGVDYIRNHELKLTEYFLSGLNDIGKYRIAGKKGILGRTGVVSVVHADKSSSEVASLLSSEYNIAVRAMYHCAPGAHEALRTSDGGTVRISTGIFTSLSEVKTLLYALEHI